MKVVTMLFPRTFSVYSSTIHAGASASRIAALGALLLTCAVCSAQDALARLILPDAPVIAGMQQSSADNSYDRVWLATAKNLNDLKEFILLTDTGAWRRFDRVIVTASPLGNDLLGNHLLIAEGLFDLSVMNQTIAPGINEFHGIPITVVKLPSSSGAETLWLANLHNWIVLFGSPSAVQKALLRYQSGKSSDPAVQARLNRIPRKDVAWSSITLNPSILKSHLRLNGYQRNLVPCLTTVREFVLGISFESNARIDLQVVADTPLNAGTSIGRLNHLADYADLIAIRTRLSDSVPIGTISIVSARDEYSRWVDMFRHHTGDLLLAAAVPY